MIDASSTTTYSYDSMDRLTEKATPKGSLTYTYDGENHLVSMGSTVALVYDGDGNRVSKTVTTSSGSTTTTYLIDDLNPTGYPQVVDELVNGAVSVTYTYGFQRISEDRVVSGSIVPSWYMYDGLGNVRGLTNSAGTQTDTYEYDAFGNSFTVSGSTANEMMYRGEQLDSDLGLYYLRARYYNPLTGRFMSRDPEDHKLRGPNGTPIDPKELHKYLYANGDPVNATDPTGRDSMLETGSLDELIKMSAPELLVFGGAVGCAFGVDATAIALLNGGNGMDTTLGLIGLFYGCGTAGLGYFF